FAGRGRHTRFSRDWSSDVCSSDLGAIAMSAGLPTSASIPTSASSLTSVDVPMSLDVVVAGRVRRARRWGLIVAVLAVAVVVAFRSEERRVGKGGGAGMRPGAEKNG